MKSEKAKEFLRTKQPGDIAQYEISLWKAERAVEIAEEEMIEKAVKAFCDATCSILKDDKCGGCLERYMFVKQLNR